MLLAGLMGKGISNFGKGEILVQHGLDAVGLDGGNHVFLMPAGSDRYPRQRDVQREQSRCRDFPGHPCQKVVRKMSSLKNRYPKNVFPGQLLSESCPKLKGLKHS